ncbi:MAG: hypothetical protein ACXVRJ_12990 [Gaiellaceae bacterium]
MSRGSRTPVRSTGLAAALVVALAAALLGARHASPSEVSPVSPAHEPWHAMWTWGVVAAFVLYVAGTWLARGGAYSLRTAVAVAVVVQVIGLGAPLLLSKDVYLYWSEARIAIVHHANPYTTTPSAYPDDPAHAYVSEIWLTEKAAYGPAWEALGTIPALAAGSSARRAELGYRVLAVLGVLVTLLVVARRTRNPAAVALVGWSPLVALHFAGGGHNDAWMTALLVFAVAAPAAAAGGAAWSVAAAVKPVPAILLPLHLAARRFRAPRRWWIGLVAAAIVVAVASTAAFGTHWIVAAAAGAHQSSPLGGVHWLTQAGLRHRYAVVLAGLVFIAVYALLFRSAWRTGRARLSLAATALCLTSSLLRPWYAIWPLALAAIEVDDLAAVAAIGLSAYVLFADAVPF